MSDASPCRMGIITTHPVQYNAPWFRLLNEDPRIELHVFYTWHDGSQEIFDEGFGKKVRWDLPLTSGYSYSTHPPNKKISIRTFWNMDSPSLQPAIEDFHPDVILVIGWNFRSHYRCLRGLRSDTQVWFRGDSTLLGSRSGWREVARKQVLKHVYSRVDRVLSVGTNNREYFLHHGLAPDRITFAPHAIDNKRFADVVNDNIAAQERAAMGIPQDAVLVSFIGKMDSNKAPGDLLAAFKKARQYRDDLWLLLVGDGPLRPSLEREIGKTPLIFQLPFQNQARMPVVYRFGDVTCLPSRSETWGLCINESFASGRTVISSDTVGGAIDLITPKTGRVFPAGNVEKLTEILCSLPCRETLLKQGKTCSRFIADWSFDQITKAILDNAPRSNCTEKH
ncbi:glycosyltransferase family 4 protein [Rhodopirellula baltica]|nr:glycosyltransferase family 4 protein [Rhodopirellula baltica]